MKMLRQLVVLALTVLVALVLPRVAGAQSLAPSDSSLVPRLAPLAFAVDTPVRRPRAVEYSDAYYTRLTIHRWGSYAMLPMFVAEYALGENLLESDNPSGTTKSLHSIVAGGVGVLFTVNTVTGAWNLWDSRHDESGRTRRFLHVGLMLASDAGFLWTAAAAENAKRSRDDARHHRNIALGSIGLSTIGTAMMWFWKD